MAICFCPLRVLSAVRVKENWFFGPPTRSYYQRVVRYVNERLPTPDWAVAYAWTTIESQAEQKAELRLGSTGNVRVWLNGQSCHEHLGARPLALDADVVTVTLRPGTNAFLVKLSNQHGAWKFSLRLTRPGGGALPGVRF